MRSVSLTQKELVESYFTYHTHTCATSLATVLPSELIALPLTLLLLFYYFYGASIQAVQALRSRERESSSSTTSPHG